MNNKKPTRRTSIRLRAYDLVRLDTAAREAGTTRTDIIIRLLAWLTHSLQTDRQGPETRQQLMSEYFGRQADPDLQATSRVDVRLPIFIMDYLKFNGYKTTTCLLYALDHGQEAV